MSGLINKILVNISVICNNIVLKYVEDDIVTSMNIGHLSLHSADEKWKRAYIDVSANKILFRKLINIIDMTICLDKRNTSGKIEICQEPIIYKCSMELRLFRKLVVYIISTTSRFHIINYKNFISDSLLFRQTNCQSPDSSCTPVTSIFPFHPNSFPC